MKKKVISIMLATAILLVGCGKAATPETKPTEVTKPSTEAQTVTIWAWDKNFNIPILFFSNFLLLTKYIFI